ncbi:hypothetical protein [Sediminicoccus sp. KRV36]|uniref:hypothetical protein n=1 Tax=Sediminicoccus sp. KRV36 TaxID=3133721 RepID=UPI00200DF044|nr:hypothetical protein [Sediminicoccus rosea]UPY37849.1 hypothetical protein LHU95_03900 [Sediminicoccus rosea]
MEPVQAASGSPQPAARTRAAAPGSFTVALAGAQEATPRIRGVALSGTGGRAWEAAPNAEFRQRIAQAERSAEHARDGYGVRNPHSGALGRYQFLPNSLLDLGWKNAQGGWTPLAERHGVRSEADFLASPAAQEAAMSHFLRRVEVQLDRNGVMTRQGGTVRGLNGAEIPLTEGGLVAAAHRRGSGMLARYLAHRTNTPEATLSARERSAFQAVERRLQDFGQVAYASMRQQPNRALAAAPGQTTPPS